MQGKQGSPPVILKSASLLETHMETDKPPVHQTVEGSLLETAVRNVSRSETKKREQSKKEEESAGWEEIKKSTLVLTIDGAGLSVPRYHGDKSVSIATAKHAVFFSQQQ